MVRIVFAAAMIAFGIAAILFTADCDWYCDPSTGCYIGAGGNPTPAPGPIFSYAAPDADFNDPTTIDSTDCLVNPNTQFGTWSLYYTNAPTKSGVIIVMRPAGETKS